MRAALFHERGLAVNYKLIRPIMVDQGLSGLPTRKKNRRNLVNVASSEDLVNRNFTAPVTNALWLTDIREHKTREGTLYCCVVLDEFSRRVIGSAIDRRNEATLVNDALTMAARSRATSPKTILHPVQASTIRFDDKAHSSASRPTSLKQYELTTTRQNSHFRGLLNGSRSAGPLIGIPSG